MAFYLNPIIMMIEIKMLNFYSDYMIAAYYLFILNKF